MTRNTFFRYLTALVVSPMLPVTDRKDPMDGMLYLSQDGKIEEHSSFDLKGYHMTERDGVRYWSRGCLPVFSLEKDR